MNKNILSVTAAALLLIPSTILAKHVCTDGLPLENCSHQEVLCTDIINSQRFGNKNSSVVRLQTYLYAYGYLTVSPTGYFGTKTQEAVTVFQKYHNIDATGFVGTITRAQVKKNSCSTEAVKVDQNITNKTQIIVDSEEVKNTKIWNAWTTSKMMPLSSAAVSALKNALASVGVSTNFATTTLSEQEILDLTRKFEKEYILNKN